MRRAGLVWGLLAVSLLVAGCACRVEEKKAPVAEEVVEAPKPVETPTPQPSEGVATEEEKVLALKGEEIPLTAPASGEQPTVREASTPEEKAVFEMIHFDFDKSDIRPDARPILEKIAAYLKEHPEVKIVVEGHCDEWGTEEYNMALGERRALSTRRYLVSLGVAPERIATISFGEERPIDPSHTQQAWRLNRRCEFKIAE